MNFSCVDSSAISRIAEIDRTELIQARYRCALAPDGASIALIERQLDPPEVFPDWDEEGIRRRAKWWQREVDEGGMLLIAEEEGELHGFAVLGPQKAGGCAEMVALFVDKSRRGKGLGTELVRRLEDEARRRGIENIYVQSVDTVASVDFYRSVGYSVMCLMDSSTVHLPGMETNIALAKRFQD